MAGFIDEVGRNHNPGGGTVKENTDAVSNGKTNPNAVSGMEDEYEEDFFGEDQAFINEIEAEWRNDDRLESFYNGKNPNILHDYNSYNYIFTLASLTMADLKDPTKYKNNSGGIESQNSYIVLRSGGFERLNGISSANFYKNVYGEDSLSDFGGPSAMVSRKTQEAAAGSGTAGFKGFKEGGARNKDLFIDNVNMNCTMDLGANGSGNLTTGSFEITEPYSVGGFYEELYNASRFAGHEHYLGAPFLLTLSFVGHRFEEGDLITEVIPRATRYFPILITTSSMNVTEAGSKYKVEFTAINAHANKTIVNKLPANIVGPKQSKPTVASVLLTLFKGINANLQLQAEVEADAEDKDAKVKENTAASSAKIESVKTQGGEVAPFQHDRYMIWFPEKYGTGSKGKSAPTAFDSMLAGKSGDAYDSWKTNTDQFLTKEGPASDPLNQKDFAVANDSLIVKNPIGGSKMVAGEKQTFTGFYAVNDLDKQLEAAEEDRKAAEEKLKKAKSDFFNATKKADGERLKFEKLAEKFFKLSQADLKALFPEEGEGEGTPQLKQTLTYQDFNEIDPDDADGSGNVKVDPNVDQSKIDKLNELRQNWMDAVAKQNTAQVALKLAEEGIENAGKAKETVYNTEYIRYGSDARSWNFKKDTRVDDNIHKVIFDSVYATELDGAEGALTTEYQKTGYIPWYRIEKIAHIRGFDTYRNTEVWDYHYIIQPFKVHYSSMPLPQDVFNYDVLKQLAVREYNYIYTGKNLDVLNFDLDFNNLYHATALYRKQQTAEGSQGTASGEKTDVKPPEISQILNYSKQNRVGAKRTAPVNQGSSTTQTAPTANNASDTAKFLHDAIYSGVHEKGLISADITIVGDPVYLLSSGITNRAAIEATESETDIGEINCFSREGDVIFRFGTAEDNPTWDEIQGGESTMFLDESVYSGAYKVIQVDSTFSGGQFTQRLSTYRRPNQATDYAEKREARPVVTAPKVDPKHAPSSEENLEKMKKAPVKKLSEEDLKNLSIHGPGALPGISQQAQVEIPSSALGLQPNALGGSVFASVAEAQEIGASLNAGTFNAANFVPESAQKAIETNKSIGTNVSTGETFFSSVSKGISSVGQSVSNFLGFGD